MHALAAASFARSASDSALALRHAPPGRWQRARDREEARGGPRRAAAREGAVGSLGRWAVALTMATLVLMAVASDHARRAERRRKDELMASRLNYEQLDESTYDRASPRQGPLPRLDERSLPIFPTAAGITTPPTPSFLQQVCPNEQSTAWLTFAQEDGQGKVWMRTRGHRHRLAVILAVPPGTQTIVGTSGRSPVSEGGSAEEGSNEALRVSARRLENTVQRIFVDFESGGVDYSIFIFEAAKNGNISSISDVETMRLMRAAAVLLTSQADFTFDQFAFLVNWNTSSAMRQMPVRELILRRGEAVRLLPDGAGWVAKRDAVLQSNEILPKALTVSSSSSVAGGLGTDNRAPPPSRENDFTAHNQQAKVAHSDAQTAPPPPCFDVVGSAIVPFGLHHRNWRSQLGLSSEYEVNKLIDSDGRYHVVPAVVWLIVQPREDNFLDATMARQQQQEA